MTRVLVATTNPGKLREIRPVLAGLPIALVTLADVAPVPEPDETGATFWENARVKALAYAAATGLATLAEDSGLVIDALGGEPGVRSARFLGDHVSYPERFAEIYRRLAHRPDTMHTARFLTALAVASGRDLVFETAATIEGVVAAAPAGAGGFGYDPLFHYAPLGRTTAELTDEEKAAVSHRGRALRDFRRALIGGRIPALEM